MRHRCGFSLIELVIVVIIIGVISAIAIPRLSRGSEGAAVNAFVAELNTLSKAIDRYQTETAAPVTDTVTGVYPTELADYLRQDDWSETPLGGSWDIEVNGVGGHALAVGVHYDGTAAGNLQQLKQVDQAIDDGELTTGNFQRIGVGRYYLILEH